MNCTFSIQGELKYSCEDGDWCKSNVQVKKIFIPIMKNSCLLSQKSMFQVRMKIIKRLHRDHAGNKKGKVVNLALLMLSERVLSTD